MDYKEKLAQIRQEVDQVDAEIIKAFQKRMELSDRIADVKVSGNISISDENREQIVVDKALEMLNEELRGEGEILMRTLIALSKSRQRKRIIDINDELLPESKELPVTEGLAVAFQGVKGAWGEQAAMQLFKGSELQNLDSFEDVFKAVKEKKVRYGVVPIENSQTGAIGEVYDLLRKYGCYIVGQTWVDVKHCLMASPGTKLTDIREVMSHPEGFKQCYEFLKTKAWDLTACRNTAMAAEAVAALKDNRSAAIGSERAAMLNGLEVIATGIAAGTNKTRFISIANAPEYDASCDIVSISFVTTHRSGALCDVMFPIRAYKVNLSRIESRPMGEGKYCFFADLQGNIQDENLKAAILQASANSLYLEVLGCYKQG